MNYQRGKPSLAKIRIEAFHECGVHIDLFFVTTEYTNLEFRTTPETMHSHNFRP